MIGQSYSFIQLVLFSVFAILFYVLSMVLGIYLYNVKLNSNIKTNFINSALGLLTIIALYAMVTTGGKTINSLTLLILIYWFKLNKTRFNIKQINFKDLLPLLYVFPIVFILYGIYNIPTSIENDVRFYSKIADSLSQFKQENTYHFYNQYNQDFLGVMPYHYTELWLSSLFNHILLNANSIITLKYITYPFLISVVTYGVLGIATKNKLIVFLIFISLSLLSLHYLSIFYTGYISYSSFWLRPNFITYYLGILVLFYLATEEKWLEFTIAACIISTTSIVVMPGLFASVFFINLFLRFTKKTSTQIFGKNIILLAVSFFVMGIIYVFFSPKINLLSNDPFLEVLKQSLSIWKAVVYIIATNVFECALLLFIVFLINKYVLKKVM